MKELNLANKSSNAIIEKLQDNFECVVLIRKEHQSVSKDFREKE